MTSLTRIALAVAALLLLPIGSQSTAAAMVQVHAGNPAGSDTKRAVVPEVVKVVVQETPRQRDERLVEERAERRRESRQFIVEAILASFTVLLAGATFWLAWSTQKLWRATAAAIADAAKSANAAQDSAVAAGRTAAAAEQSAAISAEGIRLQTRDNLRFKQADLAESSTSRSDDILSWEVTLSAALYNGHIDQPHAQDMYYHRLWRQRSDSWWMFRIGLLPLSIVFPWFRRRAYEFKANEVVLGMTCREGWQLVAPKFAAYPDYVEFVDRLCKMGAGPQDIDDDAVKVMLLHYFKRFSSQRHEFLIASLGTDTDGFELTDAER